MGVGGTIEPRHQVVSARLLRAYTGVTPLATTGWAHCRLRAWVVDILNHGQQQQRIGRGPPFMRLSGVAALYAPMRDYQEYRTAGTSVDESYIVFDAAGAAAALMRDLTGPKEYCFFRDPDRLVAERLRRIGELTFYRRPGFHLAANGLMVELLGLLHDSRRVAPQLRELRQDVPAGMIAGIESYIRDHVTDPLRVADLARHAKLSDSMFAHEYSRLAGESPCRTVRRLKVEAAKRLLLQDGLSIKECASRLRFSSEFHFSRLFKRLEGIAPRDYVEALTSKK